MRRSVKTDTYYDKVRDCDVPCVLVDGKPFGWGILPDSIAKARAAMDGDPTVRDAIMMDIHAHFVKSFGKFVGKDVTIREVNESIERGYIDV